MTRTEYMNKLMKELKAFDDDFANEILYDYNRHFDEAMQDGRSEQSVCDELGNIDDFISDIPDYLRKNEDGAFADFGEDYKAETNDFSDDDDDDSDTSYTEEWNKVADKATEILGGMGKLFSDITEDFGKVVVNEAKKAKQRYDEYMTEQEKQNEPSDMSTRLVDKTDITKLKIETIAANILLTQNSLDVLSVELSRPLTKKEAMMYDIDVQYKQAGEVKITVKNNPGRFGVALFTKSEPITFIVSVPEKMDKIKLTTTSGDIDVDGKLEVRKFRATTVSGNINLGQLISSDSIKCNTVSGNVKAETSCSEFACETVSGAMKLAFSKKGKVGLNTISGGIEIKLLKDIGVNITSSSLGGTLKVISQQTVDWCNKEQDLFLGFGKNERNAKFGAQGLEIKADSVSGIVKILDFMEI